MPVTPFSPATTSRVGTAALAAPTPPAPAPRSRTGLERWWSCWTAPLAHPCFARVTGLWADPVTVRVDFDEGHGSDAPAPSGRLTGPHPLPVGHPTRLVLDDGLQGLVVIDDNGRFVAGQRFH